MGCGQSSTTANVFSPQKNITRGFSYKEERKLMKDNEEKFRKLVAAKGSFADKYEFDKEGRQVLYHRNISIMTTSCMTCLYKAYLRGTDAPVLAYFHYYENDTKKLHEIERFYKKLRKVQHPNIIALLNTFQEGDCFIATAVMCGRQSPTLLNWITDRITYTEADCRSIIYDVVTATAFLHKQGIVHQGLRPENIAVVLGRSSSPSSSSTPSSDDGAKQNSSASAVHVLGACLTHMTTMGKKRHIKPDHMPRECADESFWAPEVLRAQLHGSPSDLWSIGVLLYILLCGYHPFAGRYNEEYALHTRGHEVTVLFESSLGWEKISPSATDLVHGLLCIDPSKRLTASQVLSHPWMKRESREETKRRIADMRGEIMIFDETHQNRLPVATRKSLDPSFLKRTQKHWSALKNMVFITHGASKSPRKESTSRTNGDGQGDVMDHSASQVGVGVVGTSESHDATEIDDIAVSLSPIDVSSLTIDV